jgi:outer membrane protein OmpA-like peptidoglycan-associated protein
MHRRIVFAAALAALTAFAAPSRAQGIFGKIKQRASTEVDRKEDQAIDKAVNSITCAFTDKACIKKAHDAGTPIKVTDASGKPVSSSDSAAAISAAVAQAASVASDEPVAAAAAPPGSSTLYDRISANGRATTYGILFDVGSDHIRGESTPTLAEIGDMLKAHGTLKLTIEGHTDNVGGAAANQTLSEKRAAAVKAYLVSKYSIDATRLKSVGFGATKPVSPNTTAEGRQDNRRIELAKAP